MIPADCDTYIAACISYSNYYRDFYPLLLQLLMVLAAMVLYPYGLPFTITRKNFQQIDYFVNLFSDAERGVFRQENLTFSEMSMIWYSTTLSSCS